MLIENPYTSVHAKENSQYLRANEEDEIISQSRKAVSKKDEAIFRQLQHLIANDTFPCLAAKASLNTKCYRVGIYNLLAEEEVSNGLAHDLVEFLKERTTIESGFATFIAAFKGPVPETEEDFETLLWKQLRLLKELSTPHFKWDTAVASNPEDKNFGFSFGGRAFFVIGMHARSSRLARQTPLPVLVFNLHDQFEALKKDRKFEGLKEAIRQRDIDLQGFLNPMVSDFGEESEAKQYSGRAVGKKWKCPFHQL